MYRGVQMKAVASTEAQPLKCKGCIWGKWEGKQFCSRIHCVKEVDVK